MNKTINIRGINRNNPITNNADGNCDEIYNLRPKGGMWQAVGRKRIDNSKFVNDAPWMQSLGGVNKSIVKYHQHKVGDKINDIFIIHAEYDGVGQTDRRIMGVWAKPSISAAGYEAVELWRLDSSDKLFATVNDSLGIDIESIGNFLTFNLPEVTTFLWQGGEYQRTKQTEVDAPTIRMKVHSQWIDLSQAELKFSDADCGQATLGGWCANNSKYLDRDERLYTAVGFKCLDTKMMNAQDLLFTQNLEQQWSPFNFCNNKFNIITDQKIKETVTATYLAMQNLTTNYREGFVFVCSAYKLFDGTYTNFSTPVMLHLGTEGYIWGSSSINNIDDIDTFFNPDKFQISHWHMGRANDTPGSQVGFGLEGFVRRQRMQKLIFERPEMPTGLGEEYEKIVYFVSAPISMYDFSNLMTENLHINFQCSIVHGYLDRLDGNYVYARGRYSSIKFDDYTVRMSLGNQMNWITNGEVGWATTPKEDAFIEAIRYHAPTTEELENLTLYKAVEFSIRDNTDVGTIQQTDGGASTYGKAVNFKSLASGEVMKAETSSTTMYKAKGLLTYNQRLHMFGVSKTFRDSLLYKNDSGIKFSFFNDLHYDDTVLEQRTVGGLGIGLYFKSYSGMLDGSHKSLYDYIHHIVFTLQDDNNRYFKYVCYTYQNNTPTFVFPKDYVKYAECYIVNGSEYYKIKIDAIKSAVYDWGIFNMFSQDNGMPRFIMKDFPITPVTEEDFYQYEGNYDKWIDDADVDAKKELYVSEQFNPIVFPPELNYRFDDEIVALGINYKEISLAQDGQYPLYVFTKKGIWSMSLGTEAFYANQIPVHPDVAVSRNTLGIGGGVVYVAKDGIKVINGREVVSLSEPLRGRPSEVNVNTSLLSALGHGQNPNRLNSIYSSYMNSLGGAIKEYQDYDLFNENITLGFDRMNNELLVCNSSGSLTYLNLTKVFNFNTNQWYTRTERFYSFFHDYGCRMRTNAFGINVSGNEGVTSLTIPSALVDLTTENNSVARYQQSPAYIDAQVMIITRPMSLGNLGFKQLNHIALRGELKQNGRRLGTRNQTAVDPNNAHLGFYIFASNDGGEWHMVGGKCWKESVSQVVLERVKQSYRYIVFVLAGYVEDDFNITHIDLDGIDKLNNRQR